MALQKLFGKKDSNTQKPVDNTQKVENALSQPVPAEQQVLEAYYGVLYKPVISEKSTRLQEQGTYAFFVHQHTNKIIIARAVAARFGVGVVSVRIVKMPRKKVRKGKFTGWKPGRKKAFVTLQKGHKIELA
jgi:large subunit ribosomal protein L23